MSIQKPIKDGRKVKDLQQNGRIDPKKVYVAIVQIFPGVPGISLEKFPLIESLVNGPKKVTETHCQSQGNICYHIVGIVKANQT